MAHLRSAATVLMALTIGAAGWAGPVTATHPPGKWTSYGPHGGTVTALERGPDGTFYAGTGGNGVFASVDGGTTWQRRGGGLPTDVGVSGIAASPTNATRVYLSSWAHGAYRSDDAGLSWRRIHHTSTVMDVAVDPVNPDIVILGNASSQTLRSTDGGTTWTALAPPNTTWFSTDIVEFAPSNPRIIYANEWSILWRSLDGGATWQGTNGYLPTVTDLAVHPTDPFTVYATTGWDGVQISNDGGLTWRTGTGMPDAWVSTVAIDPSTPSTVYAGTAPGFIYRSVDSGATWQRFEIAGATGMPLDLLAAPGGTVLIGLDHGDGMFRSNDSALTWTRSSTGVAGHDVRALVVAQADPNVVLAGTYGDGVHRSADGGHSWARTGLDGLIVHELAMPSNSTQTVVAATDDGAYRSVDGGASWTHATPGIRGFFDITVAPSNPAVVYAGAWQSVFKSNDGGQTWQSLNVPQFEVYTAIAVHPTNPDIAWAGSHSTTENLLRTTDGGQSWQTAFTCHGRPRDLAVDPRQPQILYAGCDGGGVYRSQDSGSTWQHITPLEVDETNAVVVDPLNSQHLYAGSFDGSGISGVYRSLDGGATWSLFIEGMTTTWTHALAFAPTGSILHAGTTAYGLDGSGGGVFSYPIRTG